MSRRAFVQSLQVSAILLAKRIATYESWDKERPIVGIQMDRPCPLPIQGRRYLPESNRLMSNDKTTRVATGMKVFNSAMFCVARDIASIAVAKSRLEKQPKLTLAIALSTVSF